MAETLISQSAFEAVTALFLEHSGIRLADSKRRLVSGRLQALAQRRGQADDLDAYVDDLLHQGDAAEIGKVIDRLTTNETYFFREPQHFDALADAIDHRPRGGAPLRVWSAASSSGEEAYSAAMLLAEKMGLAHWQVVGTDLSSAMVESARRGLFLMERARHLPPNYLKRWCLKGHGEYAGQLLVARDLRERVRFDLGNLMEPLPDTLGEFEVIFLRNVLIYFDTQAKAEIVRRVLGQLAPDGLLFTGHAESIANLDAPVRCLAPAIYAHAH